MVAIPLMILVIVGGFPFVVKVPSTLGVTKISKNGIEPSAPASSVVNLMDVPTVMICWKNSSLCDYCWTTKVSSTYLLHILLWLLSHWRYWSVWVGFLYTFVGPLRHHVPEQQDLFQEDIGHSPSGWYQRIQNFKIIGREGHNMTRKIKEAIYMRVNNSTLNRNIGKYNLPHLWDGILHSIPELKISK